ncbi:heterokaryon incompatibility protein [Venturia nashicola]|uniref:Heterokaryon incompatibility protein n=1 Tax=Venturia nashicola TaxID=86259 RepID=A0A4Z1NUL5_9PEZI|nr:heterokaryon incompatibility protein [Venturia nashicola]
MKSFPAFGHRSFSSAWIDVMDLRPWEPPEYYKVRYRYESSDDPEKYLAPQGSSSNSVRGTSIQCFTEENDPARQLGMRWIRHIGEDTSSSSSLELAKAWLKECLPNSEFSSNYHRSVPHHSGSHMSTRLEADVDASSERPSRPFDDQNPNRLLKIEESTSGDLTVRVVDTQNKPYRYAALSYCWGKQNLSEGSEWLLTTENNNLYHVDIVLQDLPPTIRDSISIAWSLGIEYLWIDALCIIQNSAFDWAQEAAKMGGIYFGSVITIAVAGSSSALEGCFNSKSERSTELKEFEDLAIIKAHFADGQESCLYFLGRGASIPDMYQNEIVDGPLSKRAWTYQEYICPRRILYFTSKQIFWECTHCRLSEDNFPQVQSQRPYPILDFEYALDHNDIASFWYIGAVQQYSQRRLTFEGDKLIAISALARATHCLLWCRSGNGRKLTTFACPSWSWASQNSSVSYELAAKALRDLDDDEEKQRREEYRVQHQGQDQDQEVPRLDIENRPYQDEFLIETRSRIVGVEWEPDPINAFGNVRDAYIDLHTMLGTGIVLRDNFGKRTSDWYWADTSVQAIMMPYISPFGRSEWWRATAIMDDAGMAGGQVAIALIRDSQTRRPAFLLLEPPDLEAKIFRRVGLARLDSDALDRDETWKPLMKDWAKRTIRLV